MKGIGPTFADELRVAGISGEGIAWGADGVIQFRADVPQATRNAVLTVYAAHDPTKKLSIELAVAATLQDPALRAVVYWLADALGIARPEAVRRVAERRRELERGGR